jgi:hypothetical protein
MAPLAEDQVPDQTGITFQKKKETRYIPESIGICFPNQEKSIKIQSIPNLQAPPLSDQHRQAFSA